MGKKLKRLPNMIEFGMCTTHQGKMHGIPSYSTDCTMNPTCIARAAIPSTICEHCYAQTYLKYRKNLERKTLYNSVWAACHLWSPGELPFTNYAVFRFEAFGDLLNVTHARNYIRLAKHNPQTVFSLYTKNYSYFEKAVALEGGKPDNMVLVVSSPGVNESIPVESVPLADHVFTVYGKKTIKEKGIKINCGARDCLNCRKCYTREGPVYINEVLRGKGSSTL